MKIEIIDSGELSASDSDSCICSITLIGTVNYTYQMFKGKTIRIIDSDEDLPKNILIRYSHRDDKKGGVTFLSNIPSNLISGEVKKSLIDMVKRYIESVRSSTTTL